MDRGNLSAIYASLGEMEESKVIDQHIRTPVADQRKLFATFEDQSLSFFLPQSFKVFEILKIEGKMRVASLTDVFQEGEQKWKNAMVAQFIGKIPNFSAFQKMVNILQGEGAEIDIRPTGLNIFIIQFPNFAMRDKVLESRPWHIQNKSLIVRK